MQVFDIDNTLYLENMSLEERLLRFEFFKEIGLVTWVNPQDQEVAFQNWLKEKSSHAFYEPEVICKTDNDGKPAPFIDVELFKLMKDDIIK